MSEEVVELIREIERLQQWVNDLQSGMYINCVYCGHRYGPREDTPVAMSDVLREHIEQCPEHPLSEAKKEIERLKDQLTFACKMACDLCSSGVPLRDDGYHDDGIGEPVQCEAVEYQDAEAAEETK